MTKGLHDHPGIYPTLPGKECDPSVLEAFTSGEDDTWRECWEFVLTHEMTEVERSAFWHGASLVRRTPPAPTEERPAAEGGAGRG